MENKPEGSTGTRQGSGTKADDDKGNRGSDLEGLPGEVRDSPYMRCRDLEDYKRQGYGTEGHLQPKPGRGAGATDAPTPSGAGPVSSSDDYGATAAGVNSTYTINRQGVP